MLLCRETHLKAFMYRSKSSKTVKLFALLFLLLPIPLTGFCSQVQYELDLKAAGRIIYASPGDDLSAKANSLAPGDMLILRVGLYSNSQLQVDGIHGTPTEPITIQAEFDGKAIIDS